MMLAAARLPELAACVSIEHQDAENSARYATLIRAAPAPPVEREVALGKETPGVTGAMYRLLERCDYREVGPWIRGEVIRTTEQRVVIGAIAAMVASCVVQLAGMVTRSQMQLIARECMQWAVKLLDEDIAALQQHKKAETVIQNRIRVIDGGLPDGG